ncbi:MAG TPA: bifunctional phosphopantothenoylcysteine decarboxylase/phosphopantothenate--cysteine ligase CoaBC [Acetivibrio sp.]|uniref:bifunctional phosphopantothenoylcysteine decarboxylase/phosphopantothenate--cysteine ligase CoaBC n=1 Tax=Acetivibrio sp. TaxID=1872092 RepID=UPI002C04B077|nr:bifunctional phosphopantothenoylcysteine decarboxylase/phosphopantothenate--cysteine ligase CoaBC [Acetivibrio sp.]HOM02452.1 bifunctional phosphopantothenoylcysteine decarboxylase/phosphopantothenate--cysteine ligase CoaBC [Acetivibrio sp.]
MLKGKTVVVGVCGGIAAYKAVEVVSRLKKLNADVHVIMTKNAEKFVAPLTFRSICHNPVITDMFEEPKIWDIQHISLAQKADLVVVAPATANIIGKVAGGIADDMLSTTIMAAHSPVLFVPAMNDKMYENPIVQENIQKLALHGYLFMEPDTGLMACGTSGKGRFPSPERVVDYVKEILMRDADYEGLKILVTAGPTREPIDPVRYISNHSSGKMGYAVAKAALERGACVKLVTGPVNIAPPSGAEVVRVSSAVDMYNEVMKSYESFDVIVMVAAVADYRCASVSEKKIKKSGETLTIELVKNPDIAAELGKVKGDRILVGFSAETDNLLGNAVSKLALKNMDMIVANDVTMEGAGFGVDTNIVKLIKRGGSRIDLPVMSKENVAHKILDEVLSIRKR